MHHYEIKEIKEIEWTRLVLRFQPTPATDTDLLATSTNSTSPFPHRPYHRRSASVARLSSFFSIPASLKAAPTTNPKATHTSVVPIQVIAKKPLCVHAWIVLSASSSNLPELFPADAVIFADEIVPRIVEIMQAKKAMRSTMSGRSCFTICRLLLDLAITKIL